MLAGFPFSSCLAIDVDEEKVEELPEDRSAKLKLWRSWKLPRPEAVKGMSISDIKDMLAASGSPFKARATALPALHCLPYPLLPHPPFLPAGHHREGGAREGRGAVLRKGALYKV